MSTIQDHIRARASERMRILAQCVHSCTRVMDVGCDHGLVTLLLGLREDIEQILASDISAPSLKKLEAVLQEMESDVLHAKIECVVADGLPHQWEYTDAIVIAGMGGDLILRILQKDPYLWSTARQLVLSPHTATEKVRKQLRSCGWHLEEEYLVMEKGHVYPILSYRPLLEGEKETESKLPVDWQDRYGRLLLERRDPLLHQQLQMRREELRGILEKLEAYAGASVESRKKSLQEELQNIDQVLYWWKGESDEDRTVGRSL